MKRARTWRPILLLGVILVGLAWPASGQEIEDDGALEETIRDQREHKPIDAAPIAKPPATETEQPPDTTEPPGGGVDQPDVKSEDPVGKGLPPDIHEPFTPTPGGGQPGPAQGPEKDEKWKRELAEKKERERKLAREQELERELQEWIRREDKINLKEEGIGPGSGKPPLGPEGLDIADQPPVVPGVGKGTVADTGGAAVPQFDIAMGIWSPSIDIQAGDFGTASQWSLTDDFGVDADQEFSEFSIHYRGDRHSFFLSTWNFGFSGQGTPRAPIRLVDVETDPEFDPFGYRYYDDMEPVNVEGEITNLTIKYSLALVNAPKLRLKLLLGGTYLLISNVSFDSLDQGTIVLGGHIYQYGGRTEWEADFFAPFYGGRVELGPRHLYLYIDASDSSTEVESIETESFVGEAGIMWAPTRWLAFGGGYRVLELTITETEMDPITNELFFGNVEFEGATFWAKFIF